MSIGILETGRPAPALASRHGDYVEMAAGLLAAGAVPPPPTVARFAVIDGEFPDSATRCDAWVVTGSRHSATEEAPWMLRLEALLREAVAAGRPVIGLCFGHQILAKALGGRVEPSPFGWQLGLQDYRVIDAPDWLADLGPTIGLNAIHQDHVSVAPPGASLLATAPHCPNAALVYGKAAISFQGHPEFTRDFERDLLALYGGDTLPADRAGQALAAMEGGGLTADALTIADALRRFIAQK
ncbi:glutamine amidotransferase [Rhodospirillum rubrum]|uniref:type 1 glutamine amidotransferase n=1 Tax=Rhodospirillum rubrum TaxID=1085 RepID=UPI0019052D2B|nr:type 1 glutamine amidotransferase [Rhodospirillum rubrum]MBK1664842.1 glutamine amidotransferase [Rhodospirillum rubrum]MBK1677112.1 glutamine amidotransferase [Rhodospirillum rubrum]